jgi:alpha-L-rhamnosidase
MCIQPSLLTLADGSLKALCRTKNGRLAITTSHDGGETWSKVELTDLPNNNSGIDAVTMKDGRHVIVYNPVSVTPGEEMGARTPLVIAISSDGDHWSDKLTLEDDDLGEYSYPAVIQGQNGNLYCTYTWHRQRIAFWEVDLPEVK